MVLLINCAGMSSPGPIQVALSFIRECVKMPEHQYYIFASNTLYSCIDSTTFPSNFHFYTFKHHPAYGIKGYKVKRQMTKYEKQIRPDCVFTVFGPSTWKPGAPHLQGYPFGHYIYRDSPAYKIMSLKERLHYAVLRIIHSFFLKRDGKYFVCETNDVSSRLCDLLKIPSSNVFTVTNCYSHFYNNFIPGDKVLPSPSKNEFRFLLFSSALPHKHLIILNQIIPILKEGNCPRKISFVVTLKQEDYDRLFDDCVKDSIFNFGRTLPSTGPQLYYETDALFAPTLIECFSANYPESMVMERPIITTDLPFAHSICGDAALFFSPLDPTDAADKIIEIATNKSLRDKLVSKGKEQLKRFDTPKTRAEKYIAICKKISNRE